ncbi:MAG: 50S ribosomal protein L6 [Deltaproteobacteria bacterium]|nr:50S ribosomal protein L6 [Deltaproteobacteria bacterium]MBM4346875.1 50S ribosomal protein L6 [Deltaproteobacteria bacterium]
MSRIGRMPIQLPKEVKVSFDPSKIEVAGPKGTLACDLPRGIAVSVDQGKLLIQRDREDRVLKALHGLTRSLVANMVTGVTKGFEKKMEIIGVGFRADLQGNLLKLTLGFSHPVLFPIPEGIKVEVDKQTLITVRGVNKQLVGTVAAKLRSIKPPEPYKGKGIRYHGEKIRKKVGKTKA